MKPKLSSAYQFTVLMEVGPAVTQVVGDVLQVTSDGGLRIYIGKALVGAVRPGKWSGCVLRPRPPIGPQGDRE